MVVAVLGGDGHFKVIGLRGEILLRVLVQGAEHMVDGLQQQFIDGIEMLINQLAADLRLFGQGDHGQAAPALGIDNGRGGFQQLLPPLFAVQVIAFGFYSHMSSLG